MEPYRLAAEPREEGGAATPAEDRTPAAATFLPLAVLWVASVARVVGCFTRHEPIGAEATIAMLAILLVPGLMRDASSPRRRLKTL